MHRVVECVSSQVQSPQGHVDRVVVSDDKRPASLDDRFTDRQFCAEAEEGVAISQQKVWAAVKRVIHNASRQVSSQLHHHFAVVTVHGEKLFVDWKDFALVVWYNLLTVKLESFLHSPVDEQLGGIHFPLQTFHSLIPVEQGEILSLEGVVPGSQGEILVEDLRNQRVVPHDNGQILVVSLG